MTDYRLSSTHLWFDVWLIVYSLKAARHHTRILSKLVFHYHRVLCFIFIVSSSLPTMSWREDKNTREKLWPITHMKWTTWTVTQTVGKMVSLIQHSLLLSNLSAIWKRSSLNWFYEYVLPLETAYYKYSINQCIQLGDSGCRETHSLYINIYKRLQF